MTHKTIDISEEVYKKLKEIFPKDTRRDSVNILILNYFDSEAIIGYCKECEVCVKACKGGAVYENPIQKGSGIITHIDRSKCIKSIISNAYCSFCLRICPQGHPKND